MNKGKIIVAFGLPGSGKSSVIKELGKLLKIDSLHEPEEGKWGNAVTNRKASGNFTAIMWFRSERVPLLYQAEQKREQGKTVLLDSYYDKLFYRYMSEDGIQWLFEKTDDYFNEMKQIAEKDYNLLPDVDCIVFFKVDFDTWTQFVTKRNRNLDNDKLFQEKCFESQQYFFEAAQTYCEKKKCQLLVFEQFFSSPKVAAKQVLSKMRESEILE
jgi:thymidylate kinase